jgi:hypothetical protein
MKSEYFIDENGYRRFADSKRLLHRWIAEQIIGRRLQSCEVVHHINGNKLDNHPDNLLVCDSQEVHQRIHNMGGLLKNNQNNGIYVVHRKMCYN